MKAFLLALTCIILIPIVLIVTWWSVNAWFNDRVPEGQWYSFQYPSAYIKVIDQNLQPVANADIFFQHGGNYWIYSNAATGNIRTDENGIAVFKCDGREFEIKHLVKDGYHIDFQPQMETLTDNQSRRMYTSDIRGLSKNNPLLIHAWKFSNFPVLVSGIGNLHFQSGETRKIDFSINRNLDCIEQFYISQDCVDTVERGDPDAGAPLQVGMFIPQVTRKKHNWNLADEHDLKITITTTPSDEKDRRAQKSWQLDIDVNNGGIIETDDLYIYRAPTNGYLPHWSMALEKTGADSYIKGFDISRRKFYLKLKDGKAYGRLYMRIEPFDAYTDERFSTITVEYFINNKGDTNLETPLRPRFDERKIYYNYPQQTSYRAFDGGY